MFNSELFEEITDYSDYTENPLILAVNSQYRELLDFVDHQWRDAKEKGINFETHFKPFFPPGYIERDPIKAQEI